MHAHDLSRNGHGHSHGLVDESIIRSKAGVNAVSISLAVLLATAIIQTAIYWSTNSVSLLAHLIHNFGDALTAAGIVGLIGNEIAAVIRLNAGKRLNSPALIADGKHARVDGLVSLSLVASAFLLRLAFRLPTRLSDSPSRS